MKQKINKCFTRQTVGYTKQKGYKGCIGTTLVLNTRQTVGYTKQKGYKGYTGIQLVQNTFTKQTGCNINKRQKKMKIWA
jgi:hypothetical protein